MRHFFCAIVLPLAPLLLAACRDEAKSHEVFASGADTTVLAFVSVDCPISNRYLPAVEELHKRHDDVAFWLVYPNAKESPAAIASHRDAYGIETPFVRDTDHVLVNLAGVTVTPEAAVFGSDRKLRYRGRIDDRYVAFGEYRQAPTRRDLAVAIENTSAELVTTRAIGCAIVKP